MDCAEAMLKSVLEHALSAVPHDMAFFDACCNKGLAGFAKGAQEGGLIARIKDVIDKPFVRMTYTEALEKLLTAQNNGHKFE